jgi:hypothetical protein
LSTGIPKAISKWRINLTMTLALFGLPMDLLFGRPDYSYVPRTFPPLPVSEKTIRKKAIGEKRTVKKAVGKSRASK